MNSTLVTVVGHVASEVRYATTASGVPVASFRLAATDRRFDKQREVWVDGDTSFYTVWSWRWLAENVLASVGRGDPLLVTGRMRVREWDNGEGKPRGYAAEIEATAIGHDLSRGTSAFRRAVRGRPELVAKASTRTTEPVEDAPGAGIAADPRPTAATPSNTATATASAPVLVGAAPPGSGERGV
ncbi:single-stranded DNA-binding protein [Streptacidiphilus sp. N1-10]|uniref:Single-stranded DNA-binding protein n=1 Tax=Streptacidiphilus jeojiensis TaxID=3229225 RepID=A0ABV6XYX6_9ACTN